MQPSGDLGALGIMIEQPYLHNLLDKLGVQPQLDQRREYKGGINVFSRTLQCLSRNGRTYRS